MLPYISKDCPFPPVNNALSEPNGLLAVGADLSIERLLAAYSKGVFPWYSPGEPILWWSPDPRTVFFIDQFKPQKSVKKTIEKQGLSVSLNQDFEQVIRQCSLPRSQENGTWITQDMIDAYIQLHQMGQAHSVEVWQQQQLVGGIYGVVSNGVFCGESMFSAISNGSKIALSCLAKYLAQFKFSLLDCQVENPHLLSLGAVNISRKMYLDILSQRRPDCIDAQIWKPRYLDWQKLLVSSANV